MNVYFAVPGSAASPWEWRTSLRRESNTRGLPGVAQFVGPLAHLLTVPGWSVSLMDVLDLLGALRDKGESEDMAEFLRDGQGRKSNLWLVAQAVSAILPGGDREKQPMQGPPKQRDQLQKAWREAKLFLATADARSRKAGVP